MSKQKEKRSTVTKPKKTVKVPTRAVDFCVTCTGAQTAGLAKPIECACGGLFCQHTALGHQKACIPYKIKHARLRRNALARQLERILEDSEEDGIATPKELDRRTRLLAEVVVLLLEAADRK